MTGCACVRDACMRACAPRTCSRVPVYRFFLTFGYVSTNIHVYIAPTSAHICPLPCSQHSHLHRPSPTSAHTRPIPCTQHLRVRHSQAHTFPNSCARKHVHHPQAHRLTHSLALAITRRMDEVEVDQELGAGGDYDYGGGDGYENIPGEGGLDSE